MDLKKINVGFCFFLCFFVTTALNAQDIESKTIKFDPGSTSATIEGSIRGYEIVDYLLNVQKGQLLNVGMATDNAANYFNIMEPGEDQVAIFNGSTGENMFERQTEKSGDYRIRVYLMRSAARRNEKANYRLETTVSALNAGSSGDAMVAGTEFHATGKVACRMAGKNASEYCDFGVIRSENGGAIVKITKADGRPRNIFFENGEAMGYDKSEADLGEFKASKKADLYIIQIGKEYYEIPEAVIFGG
ncbi:hypothetical protein E0K83_09455 [Gramella sp. BOM4]|nr:hypothetical protein [Christiangramia bathymodioli]